MGDVCTRYYKRYLGCNSLGNIEISRSDYSRITEQLAKNIERLLIFIHQPKLNTHFKKGYAGRDSLKVISMGCPFSKPCIRVNERGGTMTTEINELESTNRSRYEALLEFIRNLGDDIEEEPEHRRLSFSSISKITKKRKKLVYLFPAKTNPFTVHIRQDTFSISYPQIVETISGYTKKENTKDWYPHFKIKNDQDFEKAKQIIRFSYGNL